MSVRSIIERSWKSLAHVAGNPLDIVLTTFSIMFLILVPYFAFRKPYRVLGPGVLARLFFTRPEFPRPFLPFALIESTRHSATYGARPTGPTFSSQRRDGGWRRKRPLRAPPTPVCERPDIGLIANRRTADGKMPNSLQRPSAEPLIDRAEARRHASACGRRVKERSRLRSTARPCTLCPIRCCRGGFGSYRTEMLRRGNSRC